MKKALMVCGLVLAVCGMVYGAALTGERDTNQRLNEFTSLTVASNSIIYAGSLVCVNSSGLAVPAADSAGFAVVGRAEATVDNRTAVYSATRTIKVARGTFQWANADVIVKADIGKIVYVSDDQTVNKTGGGQNIIAGSVVDVDSSGVWVDTAKVGPIGAATPSSLAVSGAATVGTTLGVTGVATLTGNAVANEVDARTATALLLGKATATSVTIGASDADVSIPGALGVTGAIVGSSTIAATGYKIGATSGYSGSITNLSTLSTNIMQYAGGVLTNSVNLP
jgi:hypothetical protein